MDLKLDVQRDSFKPLYQQLVDFFVEAIDSGRLSAGVALPSVRDLHLRLGISRDTILRCYAELRNMSYVTSWPGKGNFVLPRVSAALLPADAKLASIAEPKKLSQFASRLVDNSELHSVSADFAEHKYGSVPDQYLPVRRWREILHAQCQDVDLFTSILSPEILGLKRLRRAIASYLNRLKDLNCEADYVAVFANSFSAQSLLVRLLLDAGETIAVEEPGYGGIKNIACAQGVKIHPTPIDEKGLIVSKLNASPERVRAVYVTPSRHDPTGVVMSLERRKELLAWACENDAWIIEDDHDGDYRYEKTVIPKLKALDIHGLVIYCSSFWKMMYPLTLTGFCIVPPNLLGPMTRAKTQGDGLSEAIIQMALATLLDEGYLDRHIGRNWRKFALLRHNCLIQLQNAFGSRVVIKSPTGGSTVVIYIPDWDKEIVLEAARISGLPLASTTNYYLGAGNPSEYLLDFVAISQVGMQVAIQSFAANLWAINQAQA